jgi:hypothetical protein
MGLRWRGGRVSRFLFGVVMYPSCVGTAEKALIGASCMSIRTRMACGCSETLTLNLSNAVLCGLSRDSDPIEGRRILLLTTFSLSIVDKTFFAGACFEAGWADGLELERAWSVVTGASGPRGLLLPESKGRKTPLSRREACSASSPGQGLFGLSRMRV